MSKQKPSQNDVWDEKLAEVNVPAHWVYLFGVLGGGFLVMVALMTLMSGVT